MMAEINIKSDINASEIMRKIVTKELLQGVGETILNLVKKNTADGISSVEGGSRRFEAYKDVKKYPGKLKPQRPVNLFLTGKMTNALSVNIIIGGQVNKVEFYFDSVDELLKYETHHYGKNGVPSRKMFPVDRGENFSQAINLAINKELEKGIEKAVKELNASNQGGI
jgi:hypothetical protein